MSVVFFSSSKHLVEFDWMLPLIIEYSKKENVVLICSNTYSFENVFFKKYDCVKKVNINIIYKDDIFPFLKSLCNITNNLKILNLISRFLNYFINYDILKHICNDGNLIFASNYPTSTKRNLENLFYLYSKKSKGLFIGTPIVPWVHWYQSYIYDFDYFLCSSTLEFLDLKKIANKSKILFLGCPSFDSKYLKLYDEKGLQKSYIQKKMTILFIMVNTFNPIYSGFDIYGDLFNCIKKIELKGFLVIIKLHPTSYYYDLSKLKKMGIGAENFTTESIDKLNTRVDIAVTYLSTAILKCISRNIYSYVYLPSKLVDSFPKSQNSIFLDLYFKENDMNSCRFEDVCVRINNINEIDFTKEKANTNLQLNFNSLFCSNNSINKIVNYFELIKNVQ
jgi:hypothetical protein